MPSLAKSSCIPSVGQNPYHGNSVGGNKLVADCTKTTNCKYKTKGLYLCTCVPAYGLSSPMVVESLCCTWVSQALPVGDEHQWGAAGTCCAGLVGERETRALLAPQKPFLGRKVSPSRG